MTRAGQRDLPPIRLEESGAGGGGALVYALAGSNLLSRRRLPPLGEPAGRVDLLPLVLDATPRAGTQVFDGLVWLGGRRRHLAAWWHGERAWLEVERGGTWALDRGLGIAEHRSEESPLADDSHAELALGPPILLLLAARGVFSLHAAAAEVDGRLCLFLGASGAGKSTLAATGGRSDWHRLADDLVPVQLVASRLVARLDFPQLKLPARQQRLTGLAERPVAALFLLAGPGSAAEPEATPLCGLDLAMAVLGHTVVAKLFDPELLRSHLALAAALASLPAWRLAAPRDFARLPVLTRMVETLVGELAVPAL